MINKQRSPQFPRGRRNAGPTSFDPALQLSPCAQSPPPPFSLFPSFIQTTSFLSAFFALGKWLLFKFKTSSQYLLPETERETAASCTGLDLTRLIQLNDTTFEEVNARSVIDCSLEIAVQNWRFGRL